MTRATGSELVYRAIVVLCLVSAMAPFAKADDGEKLYVQTKNVVYGETDGIALVLDVFVPTQSNNGLAIVDIASGAWHSDRGKIRDHKRAQMFDIMCGRGFTVFAVRPGSLPKFTLSEMHRHIEVAIRWIKAHHADYGIDPDRLGLAGASAGGHLASLTAVTAKEGNPDAKDPLERQSTRVAAVVAFFPPTDFARWGGKEQDLSAGSRWVRNSGRRVLGDEINEMTTEEIVSVVKSISPAQLVTSDAPPFLLIHGDSDFLVPLQQSEVMRDALEEAGVPVELIVKPGGGHPWPTIHEEVAIAVDWFEAQLLGKEKEAAVPAGAGQ